MRLTRPRTRPFDPDLCSFDKNIPGILQRIYAGRGITDQKELDLGLASLPAPDALLGLPEALNLLETALRDGWSILIVGDFDADGATSTALAMLALRAMGFPRLDFLVPDRFRYGYGLTPEIVESARDRQPDLLITVDNGISSIAGVAAAKSYGMRVLITDHHLPGAELPSADAIVNPHQPGCPFEGKNLAGVGVVFYLLMALRQRLRAQDWFSGPNKPAEPNLAQWLDLVALGTVADLVPLDRINRVLVEQGLRRMRAGQCRPGILAMLEYGRRNFRSVVASDLGFAVGPRLNAAGRLEDMSLGIDCLLEDNGSVARRRAKVLDDLNRDRRVIEADMERQAMTALESLDLGGETLPWGLCLKDEAWHPGVVGLLASRVKERYYRPVIAFAAEGGERLKGSARSIPGFHIRDALDAVAAAHPGLVDKFGGHAMAAGLSLPRGHYEMFSAAFDREVRRRLTPNDLHFEIVTDGELSGEDFTLEVAQLLRTGGPWGQHFPEPCFFGDFRIVGQRVVGEKHLKLRVSASGMPDEPIDAIAFGALEKYDVEALPDQMTLVYRLEVNEFRGQQTVQLVVENILLPA